VVGIGDCAKMYANAPATTGGGLTVTGSQTITVNGTTTITASGGSGTYNYAIASTSSSNCGQLTNNTNTSGPATFTSSVVGTCNITVTDTSNPQQTVGTSVNVQE
jgi:hypothetical protein